MERRETSRYPKMRVLVFVALRGDWTFADPVPVRLPGVCVMGAEGCDAREAVTGDSGMGSTKTGLKLKIPRFKMLSRSTPGV